MEFRQPYDETYNSLAYATPVGYDPKDGPEAFLEASLTEQSFKDETDVNNIVKQFEQTGMLPSGTGPAARYGDFSEYPDFQTAQNIVVGANAAFAALPADLRDRFNNDPARLMAFIEDDTNLDEAVKLGLVNKPSPSPESAVEAAPVAEKAPAA